MGGRTDHTYPHQTITGRYERGWKMYGRLGYVAGLSAKAPIYNRLSCKRGRHLCVDW